MESIWPSLGYITASPPQMKATTTGSFIRGVDGNVVESQGESQDQTLMALIARGMIPRTGLLWEPGHPGCLMLTGKDVGEPEMRYRWSVLCLLSETEPSHIVVLCD